MHASARNRRRLPSIALGIATLVAVPGRAWAQADFFKPAVQFEARFDALGGPPAGAQAGIGANVALGYYLRLAVDAAAGASSRAATAVASGRVDVVTRYLLDPFRQFRWGPYAGAGFTAQWDQRGERRGDVLLLVGIEGPVHTGWRTSVELGLGGGARLGVVLRRARSNGR